MAIMSPLESKDIKLFDLSALFWLIVEAVPESVLKPDHNLRGCAYNQGCYDDLMEIREHVLEYLKTLKEVTHHTYADESDELETAKLIEVKDKIAVETKPYTKWR